MLSQGDRLVLRSLRHFIRQAERGTVVIDDPRYPGVQLRRILVHPDTIAQARAAMAVKNKESGK